MEHDITQILSHCWEQAVGLLDRDGYIPTHYILIDRLVDKMYVVPMPNGLSKNEYVGLINAISKEIKPDLIVLCAEAWQTEATADNFDCSVPPSESSNRRECVIMSYKTSTGENGAEIASISRNEQNKPSIDNSSIVRSTFSKFDRLFDGIFDENKVRH